MSDIFKGVGVQITLNEPQDFLKVKETLTRIGVASKKDNTLYQSCHILHKQGLYAIVHFKELFILDGKASTISDDDIERRNTIVLLLQDWNLLLLVNKDQATDLHLAPMNQIKIVSFKDKANWKLVSKYTIGKTG